MKGSFLCCASFTETTEACCCCGLADASSVLTFCTCADELKHVLIINIKQTHAVASLWNIFSLLCKFLLLGKMLHTVQHELENSSHMTHEPPGAVWSLQNVFLSALFAYHHFTQRSPQGGWMKIRQHWAEIPAVRWFLTGNSGEEELLFNWRKPSAEPGSATGSRVNEKNEGYKETPY